MSCATKDRTDDRTTRDPNARASDRNDAPGGTRCTGCRGYDDRENHHRGPLVALDARDRRRHERKNASIDAKIIGQATARFLNARTLDLSEGGALLALEQNADLYEGELIAIGLDEPGRAFLNADRLITARVVRCFTFQNAPRVAVEFDRPQPGVLHLANAA